MPPTVAALPNTADFPDRLNPLLVKELRQGLRNRVFVTSFLLMHAIVALVIGFETLVMGAREDNSEGV